MTLSKTERTEAVYDDLDLWSTVAVVGAIVSVQREALNAVAAAAAQFADAIEALSTVLEAGGRMAYAGAGSSGMIAQLDRLELPGTFGIGLDRLPVILAGGPESLLALAGEAEDDTAAAEAAVDGCGLGPGDALVAVSASGSTPFTVAALRRARQRGCVTVGLACVPGAPLLTESQHPIADRDAARDRRGLDPDGGRHGAEMRPEHPVDRRRVAARPRLSGPDGEHEPRQCQAEAARRGHRGAGRGVDADRAAAALAEADWSIKTAVTLCAAGIGAAEARARLQRSAGDIREALR